MQSIWHRSTKIWNSLENESKVTIESFSNVLKGSTSPKAKQIVFDFLQHMIDHNIAVMIDGGSVIKKYNFIRKKKRIDYGSISMNIIGLLNGLSITSIFTNKDFLKKYTEVFQSNCSYETVNRMLTNAANIGCLEKSNGKPVVYCKINYIPKDKYHLITAKKRKNIKKKKSVSSSIVKLLEAKGLVLTDRISTAIINEIATEINRRPTTVRNAIYTARKKISFTRIPNEKLKRETKNDLVSMVRTLNIIRKMPNQNRASSTKIINALHYKLPLGGAALLTGTPTPVAVSDNPKNNCLLTDELEIAASLNVTTDPDIKPEIIIGDLVSPDKSHMKGQLWLRNNTTNSWPISVGPVDRNSLTRHIVRLAEKHSLLKVVLVTSGVWDCCSSTQKKYGHDFNFRSPCEYLVSVYPNLHILTMKLVNGHQFQVLYLNNKGTEIL